MANTLTRLYWFVALSIAPDNLYVLCKSLIFKDTDKNYDFGFRSVLFGKHIAVLMFCIMLHLM